ncbi:helix-turn-helix domain-containing protein [Macrococcus equipercicus]|uniref:Helix-turn-helix transcriptional regulator n=1 Tax=Macrococcus equipercicus TaxID=69967 RepID=A0A9Q9BWY9_9STAP|nr:helix-turn-helix transcriptional regulator [Macrococcus equipercicus]UTH14062.1 helix-turn-helix transcriptional regulator [Macrococcus equipercicus]
MIKVNLKDILRKKGMTLSELHELTGISMNSLSIFQNQKRDGVQFATLEKIATALNVSLSDILQIVQDEYTLSVRSTSFITDAYAKSTVDSTATLNFKNLQKVESIEITFDSQIITYSNNQLLVVDIKRLEYDKLSENLERLFDNQLTSLYQTELLRILSYLLIQELCKTLPYSKLTIKDDVLVRWTALFAKFILKANKDTLPRNTIVFTDRDFPVNLVPLNLNTELHSYDKVPSVRYTAYVESLNNLNSITEITIDPESFERKVAITIN